MRGVNARLLQRTTPSARDLYDVRMNAFTVVVSNVMKFGDVLVVSDAHQTRVKCYTFRECSNRIG